MKFEIHFEFRASLRKFHNLNFWDATAAISLWISLPMALRFSSSKWRRCCFTGRAPARISSECSATSLGMPGMSEGLHAKISAFAWRKSTSTASYLGSSSEPIRTFLSASLLGSRGTDLTALAGSKLPAWRFTSCTSLERHSRSAMRASEGCCTSPDRGQIYPQEP
jgi:hypothetical protein